MQKLIITVALTGNVPTKEMNQNLPVTADEIAEDVRRCADAGASVFHVHAREIGRDIASPMRHGPCCLCSMKSYFGELFEEVVGNEKTGAFLKSQSHVSKMSLFHSKHS